MSRRQITFNVVALCLTLFALLVRGCFRSFRDQVGHTQAAVGVQGLKFALLAYTADYDGRLPPMRDVERFRQALWPYVRSRPTFFSMPDHSVAWLPNPTLSFARLDDLKPQTVLLYESAPQPSWLYEAARQGSRKTGSARWVAFYPEDSVHLPDRDLDRVPDFQGLLQIQEAQWPAFQRAHGLPP